MTANGEIIAFDLTAARFVLGGTGVYTKELSVALGTVLGDRMVHVECPHTRVPSPHRSLRDRGHTLMRDLWWFQGGAASAAARRGAILLHAPIPARGRSRNTAIVVTVHDLAILRFPAKFRAWAREYSRLTLPGMIRDADAVIAPSEATRDEIVEMLGVDAQRISVVTEGVASIFAPAAIARGVDDRACLSRHRIEGPFILTVGSIEPRKNLGRLLEAVALLRSRPPYRDLRLVHVGPPGWLAEDISEIVRSLRLEESVRFLGLVPRVELAALYRAARLTVYPSLYEGFGLPLAEAFASGSPVVTSDRSSMPEVAAGAALLIDPTSVESIAEGVAQAWSDEATRSHMIQRGLLRARDFTWDKAARDTAAVYDMVLRQRSA